jgi:cytochrome c oxidase assembly protein subunit 15|tara:strand:+ start:34865 stop:35911 length:1047 start_codon:yes stop_codon:yes gene_type:complete
MNIKFKTSHTIVTAAVAFAVTVIVLGAFTRLVDAGLGCPDWPGCYGHVLWPNSHDEISSANEAFPNAPVELDKTWPEMVHRYLATGLGLFTIVLAGVAIRNRKQGHPIKLPVFLLAFIILQGMFGMWTVTLKLWPQIVTAHLMGGFTTFSLLWLLRLRLSNNPWQLNSAERDWTKSIRPLAIASFIIVILQIALGGWLTANYADVACPDLPTCQNEWLPPMDFATGFNLTQHIGPNYLGGTLDNEARVAIHFSHRVGAIITTIAVLLLSFSMLRQQSSRISNLGKVLVAVLCLQVILGLSNVYFNFPISVAVAHNIIGATLLITMVTVLYRLYTAIELNMATEQRDSR